MLLLFTGANNTTALALHKNIRICRKVHPNQSNTTQHNLQNKTILIITFVYLQISTKHFFHK